MSFLLETAIKVSLVTGLGLAAVVLLRRGSAALRHWVLAATLLTALATPLLTGLAPSWSFPVAATTDAGAGTRTPAVAGDRGSRVRVTTTLVANPASSVQSPTIDTTSALLAIWLVGVAINLGGLLLGFWRLHRVAARAAVVHDGLWVERARSLAALFALRRPVRLLQSDQPALLVTWGFFAPKVMLPADASSWADDRIHVVLAHELAHIRRSDWVIQIASELLRIVYWFNPLMWLASARLRLESERACDDAVVNLGVSGRDYATHLLEVARQFGGARHSAFPAVAIAPRPSTLERRVSAMLNTRLSRGPVSGPARLATLATLLAVALPVALFAQNVFATLSGSISDQSGGLLPGVSVVAIDLDRRVRHEVHTDAAGRFEIVGLVQGNYTLEAGLPGFETFKQNLRLSGEDMARTITMNIGSLQELVVVRNSVAQNDSSTAPKPRPRSTPPPCGAAQGTATKASGVPPLRIGGQIRQPVKVKHVNPVYPQGSAAGIVRLDTLIGTDGFVKDLTVTSSTAPALALAAENAVRQWQFDETLLNCVPVEVRMSVVVEFQ
jgi:beta-lactamase regulating signal transducer with metallopeptidase domain